MAGAAPLHGVKIVSYHKSWSYVAAWLGLQEIGYIEPNADYPTKAYLLSDGSVYPTTEAGIQALFARELGRPGPASVENPTAALKARALLIERLKRQYLERWCRGV